MVPPTSQALLPLPPQATQRPFVPAIKQMGNGEGEEQGGSAAGAAWQSGAGLAPRCAEPTMPPPGMQPTCHAGGCTSHPAGSRHYAIEGAVAGHRRHWVQRPPAPRRPRAPRQRAVRVPGGNRREATCWLAGYLRRLGDGPPVVVDLALQAQHACSASAALMPW